ncbi:hypothetical protein G5C60_48580 [Streptomyces sp. HC44]|uniref:Uncharacterized protein n=1 Tax=Streptomyces scabichelini TaxID=2711217 RepID=A0A6G4VM91_9ACTN|nr:hypothetical protein [Streptomyces scabichelini]NGO15239.1 hypothetical protein [Streptomyces scabichelini]
MLDSALVQLTRPMRRDWRHGLLPPVVAWLTTNLIAWLVAKASVADDGSKVAYWSTNGRRRWDSEHYLSIAKTGYEMFWCRERYANFPDLMCGNVAWFPGYPMSVRAFSATGLSHEISAVVVTELSLLGMFAVLWWLLGARLTWATGLTLAIGAVFPGGIYFHAMFPIAIGTLALLVCVAGLKRGSWGIAAAGGFVAASCHFVGAVAVGMLLLSAFFAWQKDGWPVRFAKAGMAAVLAGCGVLWAKWLMWQGTGRWDAYETMQKSGYGQGDLRQPFDEMRQAYNVAFSDGYRLEGHPSWLVEHSLAAHRPQLWLNIAFILLILMTAAFRLIRKSRLEVEEWAALILTVAIFMLPFFAGAKISWYRNHAQMFVGLVLVRRMPRWIQVSLLAVCSIQYAFLGAMFFAGVLV